MLILLWLRLLLFLLLLSLLWCHRQLYNLLITFTTTFVLNYANFFHLSQVIHSVPLCFFEVQHLLSLVSSFYPTDAYFPTSVPHLVMLPVTLIGCVAFSTQCSCLSLAFTELATAAVLLFSNPLMSFSLATFQFPLNPLLTRRRSSYCKGKRSTSAVTRPNYLLWYGARPNSLPQVSWARCTLHSYSWKPLITTKDLYTYVYCAISSTQYSFPNIEYEALLHRTTGCTLHSYLW